MSKVLGYFGSDVFVLKHGVTSNLSSFVVVVFALFKEKTASHAGCPYRVYKWADCSSKTRKIAECRNLDRKSTSAGRGEEDENSCKPVARSWP